MSSFQKPLWVVSNWDPKALRLEHNVNIAAGDRLFWSTNVSTNEITSEAEIEIML